MSRIQCFNFRKYGHYKNHCHELKKRKETHQASIVEERESSKKAKKDKTNFFFYDKVTILFIVLVHTMFSVHILHIYFLEYNMFKEKLYLWKKNKIRTAITMNIRQVAR
jgi:uncharacterized membrane protein YagU involved in acid resistance